MLCEELNCRVGLYARLEATNDLGETTFDYRKRGSLYAAILPTGGSEQALPGGALYADVTHKITIRTAAVPDLSTDMYFLFRGQRYDVKYFMPNYRRRDRVEIYCRLVVE